MSNRPELDLSQFCSVLSTCQDLRLDFRDANEVARVSAGDDTTTTFDVTTVTTAPAGGKKLCRICLRQASITTGGSPDSGLPELRPGVCLCPDCPGFSGPAFPATKIKRISGSRMRASPARNSVESGLPNGFDLTDDDEDDTSDDVPLLLEGGGGGNQLNSSQKVIVAETIALVLH